MKLLITFILLFVFEFSFGQNTPQNQQQHHDALKADLQAELGISADKAETILSIILISNGKMTDVAKSKRLNANRKMQQFKIIAKDRDRQISEQLSSDQVQKLRDFMTNRKNKYAPQKH